MQIREGRRKRKIQTNPFLPPPFPVNEKKLCWPLNTSFWKHVQKIDRGKKYDSLCGRKTGTFPFILVQKTLLHIWYIVWASLMYVHSISFPWKAQGNMSKWSVAPPSPPPPFSVEVTDWPVGVGLPWPETEVIIVFWAVMDPGWSVLEVAFDVWDIVSVSVAVVIDAVLVSVGTAVSKEVVVVVSIWGTLLKVSVKKFTRMRSYLQQRKWLWSKPVIADMTNSFQLEFIFILTYMYLYTIVQDPSIRNNEQFHCREQSSVGYQLFLTLRSWVVLHGRHVLMAFLAYNRWRYWLGVLHTGWLWIRQIFLKHWKGRTKIHAQIPMCSIACTINHEWLKLLKKGTTKPKSQAPPKWEWSYYLENYM